MSKTYRFYSSRNKGRFKPNWLTSLGVILALLWIFIAFNQDDPLLFLAIGGLNIITTIISRAVVRSKNALESEGGIIGFLITWFIAFFLYQTKGGVINLSGFEFQVNEVMTFYLTLAFLAWFIISPQKTSQEILWNLPPILSAAIFNLWKFSIIFLFLVTLPELAALSDIAILIFLIAGILELIILVHKQIKVEYVDIILNPLQLLGTVLAGPLTAVKWIVLVAIFTLLGQLTSNLISLLFIFSCIFAGIIALSTSITRLTMSSGVIESRVEEGKTIIPQIFQEVQQMARMESLSQFDEFYEVISPIMIKKTNKVINIKEGDKLIHLPFSDELETNTGVFIFHINMEGLMRAVMEGDIRSRAKKLNEEEFQDRMKKSVKNFSFKDSTIQRLSIVEWSNLQSAIRKLKQEEFAVLLGFKDIEEFDAEFAKLVRSTVIMQEQIRSRIRGVPAPSFKEANFFSRIFKNKIEIPQDLMSKHSISSDQEIEIIPGKGEYLFYIKKKG